ncbi:hypothetical protein P43SY_002125 [Pythium insidiosum]|uniref:Kinesin-like protein n=1 Tax=Pythium insidiosum TaxID=114742 RepID=A0AAD5M873_PYTIN|nr:hypothetical protein P43SY_002125 [Pythium insidiosum]
MLSTSARKPSQRQMLDLAFEGRVVEDDDVLSPEYAPALATEELLVSPRSLRHSQRDDELRGSLSPASASSARWSARDATLLSPDAVDDSVHVEASEPELFQAGVLEHAQRLGLDLETERDLLWIARESLVAPLPEGWFHATATETGELYYYNELTGESRWDHPCDDHFRQLLHDVRLRHRQLAFGAGSSSLNQSQGHHSELHTASYYEQAAGYTGAWTDQQALEPHQLHDSYHASIASGGWVRDSDTAATSTAPVIATTDDAESSTPLDADSHSTLVDAGRQQHQRGFALGPESPSRAELESLQATVASYEEELSALRKAKEDDAARLETLLRDIAAMARERDALQERETSGVTRLQSCQREIEELRANVDELERAKRALETLNRSLEDTQRRAASETEHQLASDAERWRKEVELANEKLKQEQAQREEVKHALATAQRAREKAVDDLSQAQAVVRSLEVELAQQAAEGKKASDDMVATAAATTAAAVAEAEAAAKALNDAQALAQKLQRQLAERDDILETRTRELAQLQADLEATRKRHDAELEAAGATLGARMAELQSQHERVLAALREELRAERDAKTKLAAKLDDEAKLTNVRLAEADDQQRSLKREMRALERDLKALQSVSREREEELNATRRMVDSLEAKLRDQDAVVAAARQAATQDAERAAEDAIRAVQAEKTRMAELYAQELQSRRKLHNRLMELQGNIRVFCRVRPIQSVELKSEQAAQAVFFRDGDPSTLELVVGGNGDAPGPDGKPVGPLQRHQFEFDHVFQPTSSQEDVFEQTRALVTSALDGYNVCIFAYGQTGSGKTHTMEGPDHDRGVNHRALQELFRLRDDRVATGSLTISMKLSMLEVYNESIMDLLDNAGASPAPLEQRKTLEIRMGKQGVYVENLMEVEVVNEKDVTDLMRLGKSHRSVGAHDFNEHSSRSHLVLSLTIECQDKAQRRATTSKLHLIDLAGSERVSKTAASGQRLKEAQNINRSLSALGDVIAALGANSKHVPYRNSKLTFLLQESLSGQSKVLMFVNVSPVQWNAWETLCSLNFASRCRNVALGLAKANVTAASPSAPAVTSKTGAGGSGAATNGSAPPRSTTGAPGSVTKGGGAQRIVYG